MREHGDGVLAHPGVGVVQRVAPAAQAVQQGLTLVPISAQLELTFPLSAQLKLTLSPIYPTLTRGCVPKVLKLS